MLRTLVLWLFTLGYFSQHTGSFILLYKIRKQQSIDGVCIDTQIIFFVAAIARFIWIFDTRLMSLPLAWLELVLSIVLSAYTLYQCYRLKDMLYVGPDAPFKWPYVMAFCGVLALIFHPGSNKKFELTVQILVAFSIYLESTGLIPQLFVLRKSGDTGGMTSHYIFCLAVSRLIRLGFWIGMYLEGDMFLSLMVADFLHCVLLADFTYYYFKSIKEGKLILAFSNKEKLKM